MTEAKGTAAGEGRGETIGVVRFRGETTDDDGAAPGEDGTGETEGIGGLE